MKRFFTLLILVISAQGASADYSNKPVLDEVFLSFSAKQWVKTETARLEIVANATLNDTDMVKTRSQIMTQLQAIAKGQWHITQFDRSQDSSGLEKLMVRAEARIQQKELNQIYQRAKSVSKPGLTYRIDQINFEPSLEDIEKGKILLREKLYQQITAEIGQLNNQYPKQKYSLNRLIFTDPGQRQPVPMMNRSAEKSMVLTAMSKAPSMDVSNQLTMEAMVVLASHRAISNSNHD